MRCFTEHHIRTQSLLPARLKPPQCARLFVSADLLTKLLFGRFCHETIGRTRVLSWSSIVVVCPCDIGWSRRMTTWPRLTNKKSGFVAEMFHSLPDSSV